MADKKGDENSTSEIIKSDTKVEVEYLDIPVKSESDKKEYRVIRLKNGLTALLIADSHSSDDGFEGADQGKVASTCGKQSESDEETDSDESDENEVDESEEEEDDEVDENPSKCLKREEKLAACGLCIGVGSFSDPPEIPGLSHFLEHMVFMGSEKFPKENDFEVFITKRGGSDNASTDCEHTTFYFEIQEKFLSEALDRFAQFFISPLMKRDAISREREAVESEFQMALPSDFCRKEQLLAHFAKRQDPASKFVWGNIKTLRENIEDDKLYQELHKYRKRHYSAHRMTLAVQAKLPLDTLQNYVTESFTDVINNQLPADDFSQFKSANSFDTLEFRRMYRVKPVKDVCQVELTWAMGSLLNLYKSKPHQYVSWILGHEGKGSLLSYLRQKMWCLNIISGNSESGFEYNSMYALFTLSLVLTDEGHENLKQVLDVVFSFINLIRKEGPQKRLYDEISRIEETNFRFTDEIAVVENVENMSENMQLYPPKDYITGNELYFEYNPQAIQDCLNCLRADNVNIIVFNTKFNEEELDKVEPWFQTKYTDVAIPKDWIETWETIKPFVEFHLPEPNVFITNNFDLIEKSLDPPKYPIKILSDSNLEVWYRADSKFSLPECYLYSYFILPGAGTSAKNMAMLDLFVEILRQLLVEELYPATAAGLNHEIRSDDKGIVVAVNGFNEKLPTLFAMIIKSIANFSTNSQVRGLFDVIKKQLLKIYYNTFLKPSKLAKDLRLSILMQSHYPAIERHSALSQIEYNEFENFIKHLIDHCYVQYLIQGNIKKEDGLKIVDDSTKILKCEALLPNTMPLMKVNEIPTGIHTCKVKNFNKTDTNSILTNYYQFGIATTELSVTIELLLLMMEEPLFDQLRTQEQLGYSVSCTLRDTFGIVGYSITVCTQANKYTTDHVNERIEQFLKSFQLKLNETTDKEFESVVEALIKTKSCADIQLKEEVERNWSEISKTEYFFDRLEKEIETLKRMKIKNLRDLFENQTRKLSTHVVGIGEEIDDKPTTEEMTNYTLDYLNCSITNIENYKRNLKVYTRDT